MRTSGDVSCGSYKTTDVVAAMERLLQERSRMSQDRIAQLTWILPPLLMRNQHKYTSATPDRTGDSEAPDGLETSRGGPGATNPESVSFVSSTARA